MSDQGSNPADRARRIKASREEHAKITAFINTKWRSRACHLCQANDWEISVYAVLPIGQSPASMVFGQQVLPCVAVVCKNCGNTHLISAVIAGLVSP